MSIVLAFHEEIVAQRVAASILHFAGKHVEVHPHPFLVGKGDGDGGFAPAVRGHSRSGGRPHGGAAGKSLASAFFVLFSLP